MSQIFALRSWSRCSGDIDDAEVREGRAVLRDTGTLSIVCDRYPPDERIHIDIPSLFRSLRPPFPLDLLCVWTSLALTMETSPVRFPAFTLSPSIAATSQLRRCTRQRLIKLPRSCMRAQVAPSSPQQIHHFLRPRSEVVHRGEASAVRRFCTAIRRYRLGDMAKHAVRVQTEGRKANMACSLSAESRFRMPS